MTFSKYLSHNDFENRNVTFPVLGYFDKMRIKVRFIFSLLTLHALLAIPLVSLPNSVAQSQDVPSDQWSKPINISTSINDSWFPDISIDGKGEAHIVFAGSDYLSDKDKQISQKYDRIYYQPILNSGLPVENGPFNVAVSAYGVAARNAVTVDNARGLIHLTYRSKITGSIFYQYAPIDKATIPAAWSEPHNIDNQGNSYYSDIVVDRRGTIHVAWTQLDEEDKDISRQIVMYRQSSDLGVTWSLPRIIAKGKFGETRVVLKLDSADGLHLSWDDGYDNLTGNYSYAYGAYTNSLDNGKTWREPLVIGSQQEPIGQTVLTPFGSTGVMLAWRVMNKQQVDYMISNDRGITWGKSATLPGFIARKLLNKHQFDRYYLAEDGKGRVHFAGVGFVDASRTGDKNTDLVVFHSIWENEEWSKPEIVESVPGYPEYPRIGIGPDRIYVVWFVRDQEINENNKYIWYSSRLFDTGIKPQQVNFYNSSTPTTMAEDALSLTPTPEAILPPLEEPAPRRWIEESYITITVSLMPVFSVGLVLLAIIAWQLRVRGRK